MKKIVRNMATAEDRMFWERAQKGALQVEEWPAWKRAGINVSQVRQEPREMPVTATLLPLATK